MKNVNKMYVEAYSAFRQRSRWGQAQTLLNKIVESFPGTPEAMRSKELLRQISKANSSPLDRRSGAGKATSFLDALQNGDLGVRMTWPSDLEVEKESPTGAYILDKRFQVRWSVQMLHSVMDINPENDALLRADTECFTRGAFKTSTPRTENPDWSPVIDFACFSIGATRALRCVYRTAYAPAYEVVVGDVLIPLRGGTVVINAGARAGLTGFRETALLFQKTDDSEDPSALTLLPQDEIDDARHDESFRDTPLSRVRRALAWRIDEAGIEVSRAPERTEVARVTSLHRAGCKVVLPRRYRYCSILSEHMSPTIDTFTRVAPPVGMVRGIDVWRVNAAPISGMLRKRKLKALALGKLKQWTSQGVSQLKVSPIAFSEYHGRLQIDLQAEFQSGDMPSRSVQRWFLDNAGRPFRVAAGGPSCVPVGELVADVDQVAHSWCPI